MHNYAIRKLYTIPINLYVSPQHLLTEQYFLKSEQPDSNVLTCTGIYIQIYLTLQYQKRCEIPSWNCNVFIGTVSNVLLELEADFVAARAAHTHEKDKRKSNFFRYYCVLNHNSGSHIYNDIESVIMKTKHDDIVKKNEEKFR